MPSNPKHPPSSTGLQAGERRRTGYPKVKRRQSTSTPIPLFSEQILRQTSGAQAQLAPGDGFPTAAAGRRINRKLFVVLHASSWRLWFTRLRYPRAPVPQSPCFFARREDFGPRGSPGFWRRIHPFVQGHKSALVSPAARTPVGRAMSPSFMGVGQQWCIPARCRRKLSPTGRRKIVTKRGVRRRVGAPRPLAAHWNQVGRVRQTEPSRHQNGL